MELFIDKDFLDDFYIDYDSSRIAKIVKNIITNYGDKKVFINYNNNESDFLRLKNENEFFALICNTTVPIPIGDIGDSIRKSEFTQTLVFTKKREDWFEEIESKGALCFCFDDYEKKINTIIDALHFKIDLSESFMGWEFLDVFKRLNYNKIVVTDGYILGDKTGQKMEKNIIPILKKLLPNRKHDFSITFFTKDLNPIKPIPNTAKNIKEKVKEKAKKRVKLLKQFFPKNRFRVTIINSNLNHRIRQKFNMHDRVIATNFSLMDAGLGFNLLPYKTTNSQIISETIFDKYTYSRLNSLIEKQNQYIKDISEVSDDEFKMFEENIR